MIQKVIKNILRLGVCQLMFFESVPESAAVNESVKLCSKCSKSQLKGFVNGVLRNIAKNVGNIKYPGIDENPAEYLSVMHSYPKWMCEKYISDYGFDFASDMLSYHADNSLICIRKTEDTAIEGAIPPLYTDNTFYLKNVTEIDSYDDFKSGKITVMSEASVICVDAAGIKAGDKVLDVCAAPGGKSAYAAEKCSEIVSCDIHEHRAELIKKTFDRLNIKNGKVAVRDASVFDLEFENKFDCVICDVLCSAMGLLHRKPDIKINKREDDIKEIISMQKKILTVCSKYVKPGGVLMYSTCTINKNENDDNIAWFLKENSDYSLEDFSSLVHEKFEERAKSGMMQLFPHLDGIDGFFMAKLRRK